MADDPFVVPDGGTELAILYNQVKQAFREAGIPTPELDARLLVVETLSVSTAQLVANPRRHVSEALARDLLRRARARLSGQSIGRILGRRAFWSLDLSVGPATLEPRPETETVVELALAALRPADAPHRIADLGTGTGAILLALLSERPRAIGVGVDISEAALREARRNAEANDLRERAAFIAADYGSALAGVFDMVVCNPPYIATSVIGELSRTVRDYDPLVALDGGVDGLDAYRAVFAQAGAMLRPGGHLIVEIDPAASAAVRAEAERRGLSVQRVADDLSGAARAMHMRAPNG